MMAMETCFAIFWVSASFVLVNNLLIKYLTSELAYYKSL